MLRDAKGTAGELRVAGRAAARLTDWRADFQRVGERVTVRATVAWSNPLYLASGGPFELRLAVGTKHWCWRDVAVEGETALSISARGNPTVR